MKNTEFFKTQKESIVNGNKNRYIVIEDSTSGHCCFKCTVVDTSQGIEDFGYYWKDCICETFTKEDADKICLSLNKLN